MNIGNLLSRNARYNPDKLALIFEKQSYTYRQLNQNVNQLANALLDRGISKGDKNDYTAKPGSVGVPLPFYEMRIEDPDRNEVPAGQIGEIVGRGPILMPQYYKRPDLTREAIKDGWLYTGDLGYVDEDGFLFLVDRKKDMIISGGINVYPKDIEEVIVQHPAVLEAAVFGIPSEKWGESPVAAVTLTESGTITPEELMQWINRHVSAKFQRVQQVIIMDELPRNIAGKVLKRVMREQLAANSSIE